MEQREWLQKEIRETELKNSEIFRQMEQEKKANGKTIRFAELSKQAREFTKKLKYLREKLAQVK